jgi:HlyD family secretion protein
MAEQDPGTMRMRVWLPVALIVCVAVFFVVRLQLSPMPVKTATVVRADIVSQESTNGKVEPTEDFQAHAPTAGVVKKIWVDLGQKVKAGQDLVQMDTADARKNLASAEASLQSAKAALQNMQAGGSQDERLTSKADLDSAKLQYQQQAGALQALQRLQAQGAASASEVASAKQRLADTQVRIAQLQGRTTGRYSGGDLSAQRAEVAQAQASVDAARSAYSGVDIHAPFGGTVYAVPVAEYDFVKDGDDLVDVADLTQLQVHAYFDEPEVGKLAVGQPVKIVWEAKPNQVWHGHIIEAPTTIIAYNTRNVGECLITVDDAKGDLLPNVNVTVTVTTSQKKQVLTLPREALHTDGASDFVYKIVGGKLVKTVVHLGVFNTTRIEVASGLNEGDVVALRAMSEAELHDGLRVKAQR